MSLPVATPDSAARPPHPEAKRHPRSELGEGLGWMILGAAVVVGSVTMDRLERQDVNPYTVPGLLPVSAPVGPRNTSRTSGGKPTIAKTTSDRSATARGESA